MKMRDVCRPLHHGPPLRRLLAGNCFANMSASSPLSCAPNEKGKRPLKRRGLACSISRPKKHDACSSVLPVSQCFLPCFGAKPSHREVCEGTVESARVDDAASYAYVIDRRSHV